MCKKLTKLVKDSEAMKEELAKYRSLYGDVDASLTVEEVREGWWGLKGLYIHWAAFLYSEQGHETVQLSDMYMKRMRIDEDFDVT